MRRVLITGMGCVTPYGTGLDAFWDGLVSGRSAVTELHAFDPRPYGCRVAGQVPDFRPGDFLPQREVSSSSRCTQLSIAAARIAIEEAKLSPRDVDPRRTGVFIGTSIGTVDYLAANHSVFLEKGIRRVHPLFPAQAYPGVVATQLAIHLGIRGPAICVSTACTSSTDAIGIARMHIRAGVIDRAIVGGTEAPLTPLLFASFDRLGVMSRLNDPPEAACRPFAGSRDGFVMSEGAGVCVLEAEESAAERGARSIAEVASYSATSDAFHPFSPLPEGDEGARAIEEAMDGAGISPDDVDYVNAHAIGSKSNDGIELEILRRVLGDSLPGVPVSSIKGMIGHTMGAAGALEMIASVCAIRDSVIPPTINLSPQDNFPGIDLVPGRARSKPIRLAISPTFGFGARNAVLVVKKVY
jgi:3-oxoacyl-[acyl-carrier-protein] synthase II